MELRHLRYFVAVAEEQNITRAAARLHVSQPPLSRQIQDLESELGFDLLERTGKSIRVTAAGAVFLKEACAVLRRVDEAVEAARRVAMDPAAEFHLGYAPSPTAEMLPTILREFRTRAPGAQVVLHDLSSPEMLSGLLSGKLHAALMVQPSRKSARGIVFEELRTYPIVVAVPPNHPFVRLKKISVREAVEEPLVAYSRGDFPDFHEMLRRIVGPLAKRLRFAEECDGVMSLIAAIESGKGVSIIASSLANAAGKRLRYVPVMPPPLPAVVGLAYRPGPHDETRRRFIEAVHIAMKNPSSRASG